MDGHTHHEQHWSADICKLCSSAQLEEGTVGYFNQVVAIKVATKLCTEHHPPLHDIRRRKHRDHHVYHMYLSQKVIRAGPTHYMNCLWQVDEHGGLALILLMPVPVAERMHRQ